MKRRKNRAVMSWLVSLHALLASSAAQTVYTALAGGLLRSHPSYTNCTSHKRLRRVRGCLPLDCSCAILSCPLPYICGIAQLWLHVSQGQSTSENEIACRHLPASPNSADMHVERMLQG